MSYSKPLNMKSNPKPELAFVTIQTHASHFPAKPANYQNAFSRPTNEPLILTKHDPRQPSPITGYYPPGQHNLPYQKKSIPPDNYTSYITPFEHPSSSQTKCVSYQIPLTPTSPHPPRIRSYCQPANHLIPPNPRSQYMDDISRLAYQDEKTRNSSINELEMTFFTEPIYNEWRRWKDDYLNLVKKLLVCSKLSTIKRLVVKGYGMTEKSFGILIKTYIETVQYREKDLLDVIVRRWYSLNKCSHRDCVEEYNEHNQIHALKAINFYVY